MGSTAIGIITSILAVTAAVLAVVFLLVPIFRGLAWLLTSAARGVGLFIVHIFRFVFGMVGDLIRALGAVLTALLFTPLVLLNVIIGRWSAAAHFGRALKDEVSTLGHCVYRFCLGHPARLLLLHGLTEGIERRIPEAMANSPGSDRPSHGIGQFEGYTIVGSLPGGGSGGRLYVADPDDRKKAAFARAGIAADQVVIKAFSLRDGSSLPQIIRESRALEAARKLGLVLDHELTDERFFYVMEFIPGDSLAIVTKRLHAEAGPRGLTATQLTPAMTHFADLLRELTIYHKGGLWHKDVKPDNIIVSKGRTRLVDLGLVTPLRSAMTLTTHGTEYFRDPELVRMALRGAKVRDVDGVKFDIYGVGAVMFSVIENSFPAHGGLSQFSKECPEALRWIVRRAMTELHQRYASADEMLADLTTILAAGDPFALKPADLPSVRRGPAHQEAMDAARNPEPEFDQQFPGPTPAPAAIHHAGSPTPRPGEPAGAGIGQGGGVGHSGRRKPAILVTDWLTGRYVARGTDASQAAMPGSAQEDSREEIRGGRRRAPRFNRAEAAAAAMPPRVPRGSATDQLARAHDRVRRAQKRVARRLTGRSQRFETRPNAGVIFSSIFTILVVGGVVTLVIARAERKASRTTFVDSGVEGSVGGGRMVVTTDAGAVDVALPTVESDRPAAKSRSRLDRIQNLGKRIEKKVLGTGSGSASDSQIAGRPAGIVSEASAPKISAEPRGSVLLLNMLPSDIASGEQGRLDALVAGLGAGGVEVRGLGASSEETDLLAAGKRVVELSSPEDSEAVERVREWLDSDDRGLDAVLWIGQGAARGVVVRRIVPRGGFDSQAMLRAIPGR